MSDSKYETPSDLDFLRGVLARYDAGILTRGEAESMVFRRSVKYIVDTVSDKQPTFTIMGGTNRRDVAPPERKVVEARIEIYSDGNLVISPADTIYTVMDG